MTPYPQAKDHPFDIFRAWLQDAEKKESSYPNAFSFASVNADSQPSVRTLLLKGLDDRGFVFYTNTQSRKGDDLRANANGAMLFYWKTCQRQIRIEGSTERVSEAEADSYFATRPRESQIGAWASAQSRPLGQYEDLQESVGRYTAQFKDMDAIPRPPHWSGYRLIPHAVEFWVEGEFRLHRRFLYRRNAADWKMVLLNP